MSLIKILFLAVALSVDACAISFAHGICFKEKRIKNSLLISGFCGFFQFLMPIIGYFSLTSFSSRLEPFSKWIVFTIFLILGLNFIKDALKTDCEETKCLNLKCLFLIAIATSIDALAAGAGMALTEVYIYKPAIIIGIITFINSMFGFFAGNILKNFPAKTLKLIAATILIFLAFSNLY